MSDLSDQLREALDLRRSEAYVDIFEGETEMGPAIPGWMGARGYHLKTSVLMLKRAHYKFQGGKKFETTDEAFDQTYEAAKTQIFGVGMKALCDGMQIGQNKSHVVKKYGFLKRMDDVFTQESFHSESRIAGLTYVDDIDLLGELDGYISSGMTGMAACSGFKQCGTPEKVWDLWTLVAHNLGSSLFLAGYRIGVKWSQEDVLAGILKAGESDG